MQISINTIQINHRHRKDLGDLESLKQSIRKIGLLHPVVIDESSQGIKINFVQNCTKLTAERRIGELSKIIPPQSGKKSHDATFKKDVLQDIGISKQDAFRYEAVASLPEKEFEKHIQDIKQSNQELTTVGVIRLARQFNRPNPGESPPLPKGKFNLLYLDPPWKYDEDLSKGATREPDNNYPTMDYDELVAFGDKIKEKAHKDCVMFMWTTAPKLDWAIPLIKEWGFKYKTNWTWDKVKPNLGYYSSARHETLLIVGRSKCAPTYDGKTIQSIDSVQVIKKTSKHSQKPDEFRKIIEKLYPNHTKIELFARGTAPDDWKFWGNECFE